MQDRKVIALAYYRRRRGGALSPPPAPPHWFVTYWRFWHESLDRMELYLSQLRELKMILPDLKIETPANEPIIVATRDFAAPRALVWKVWTEGEHVIRWFGTSGQNNKITAFDVRPGGKWRIESHEPDGQVYIFLGEYREVEPPSKLVWTFGMENMFFGKTLVETHTFEEENGITHYRSVSVFDNVEDRDGMVASGMEEGMRHGFTVMDEILAELTKG
jgi:uncharacterized protein YndB with AHSA1/START domain